MFVMIQQPVQCTIALICVAAGLLTSTALFAKAFGFTAIGDQPYFNNEAFKGLIKTINQHPRSKFTIHVGDIKNGGSKCSDEAFLEVKDFFDLFEKSLVFTPDDNEWADCYRTSNGSHQPLERLTKVGSIFFKEGVSLGQQALRVQNQSILIPTFGAYIENTRWLEQDVLFITLHQVGSNNNLDHEIPGAMAEYTARNAANMAWLKNNFLFANGKQAKAIIIAMQSDIFDVCATKNLALEISSTTSLS